MSKLSVYFLFLFLSAGAVFAQQVHSEAEVKQACINNLKLGSGPINFIEAFKPL